MLRDYGEIMGGKVSKMNVLVSFQFNTVFHLILLANLLLLITFKVCIHIQSCQCQILISPAQSQVAAVAGRTGC